MSPILGFIWSLRSLLGAQSTGSWQISSIPGRTACGKVSAQPACEPQSKLPIRGLYRGPVEPTFKDY